MNIRKITLLLVVLIGFTGLGSAVNDNFTQEDDGDVSDYVANPFGIGSSGDTSEFSAVTSPLQKGSHSVKLDYSGDNNRYVGIEQELNSTPPNITWYWRSSVVSNSDIHTVFTNTSESLSSRIRAGRDCNGETNAISWFVKNNENCQKIGDLQADTWYKFVFVFDWSATNPQAKVQMRNASNNNLISETAEQRLYLDEIDTVLIGADSGTSLVAYWDSIVAENIQDSISYNTKSVDPDPPNIGENVSYNVTVSDSLTTVESVKLKVEFQGSQVFSENQTSTPFYWENVTKPDSSGDLNATFIAENADGYQKVEYINRTLVNAAPSVNLYNIPDIQDFDSSFNYDIGLKNNDSISDENITLEVDMNGNDVHTKYSLEGQNFTDTIGSSNIKRGSNTLTVNATDEDGNYNVVNITFEGVEYILDDFEDGDVDEWSEISSTGSDGGFAATNTAAEFGSFGGELTIENGNNIRFARNFSKDKVKNIKFYVGASRPLDQDFDDTTVVYQSGYRNNEVFKLLLGKDENKLNGVDLGFKPYDGAYTTFEMAKIDYQDNEIGEFYINDSLNQTNISFNQNADNVGSVEFSIQDDGTFSTYYDNVSIGFDTVENLTFVKPNDGEEFGNQDVSVQWNGSNISDENADYDRALLYSNVSGSWELLRNVSVSGDTHDTTETIDFNNTGFKKVGVGHKFTSGKTELSNNITIEVNGYFRLGQKNNIKPWNESSFNSTGVNPGNTFLSLKDSENDDSSGSFGSYERDIGQVNDVYEWETNFSFVEDMRYERKGKNATWTTKWRDKVFWVEQNSTYPYKVLTNDGSVIQSKFISTNYSDWETKCSKAGGDLGGQPDDMIKVNGTYISFAGGSIGTSTDVCADSWSTTGSYSYEDVGVVYENSTATCHLYGETGGSISFSAYQAGYATSTDCDANYNQQGSVIELNNNGDFGIGDMEPFIVGDKKVMLMDVTNGSHPDYDLGLAYNDKWGGYWDNSVQNDSVPYAQRAIANDTNVYSDNTGIQDGTTAYVPENDSFVAFTNNHKNEDDNSPDGSGIYFFPVPNATATLEIDNKSDGTVDTTIEKTITPNLELSGQENGQVIDHSGNVTNLTNRSTADYEINYTFSKTDNDPFYNGSSPTLDSMTLRSSSLESNEPPVASFSLNDSSPQVGDAVQFDGSGSSDSNGSITQFSWDFGDGDTGSGEVVTHQYSSSGSYTVELTVTDNDSASDTTTKQVDVSKGKPTADFSINDSSPKPGDVIEVDASASSDPNGQINSYSYTFGDNTSASGKTVEKTYNVSGTFDINLTVKDDDGFTDSLVKTADVQNLSGQDKNLVDSCSNDGTPFCYDNSTGAPNPETIKEEVAPGTTTNISWEINATGAAGNVYKVFSLVNSYLNTSQGNVTSPVVNVSISGDGGGGTSSSSPPTADFSANDSDIKVGETVQFDASSSTDNGTITSFDWSGAFTASGEKVNAEFGSSGDKDVTLKVTDDDGNTDSVTKTFTVDSTSDGGSGGGGGGGGDDGGDGGEGGTTDPVVVDGSSASLYAPHIDARFLSSNTYVYSNASKTVEVGGQEVTFEVTEVFNSTYANLSVNGIPDIVPENDAFVQDINDLPGAFRVNNELIEISDVVNETNVSAVSVSAVRTAGDGQASFAGNYSFNGSGEVEVQYRQAPNQDWTKARTISGSDVNETSFQVRKNLSTGVYEARLLLNMSGSNASATGLAPFYVGEAPGIEVTNPDKNEEFTLPNIPDNTVDVGFTATTRNISRTQFGGYVTDGQQKYLKAAGKNGSFSFRTAQQVRQGDNIFSQVIIDFCTASFLGADSVRDTCGLLGEWFVFEEVVEVNGSIPVQLPGAGDYSAYGNYTATVNGSNVTGVSLGQPFTVQTASFENRSVREQLAQDVGVSVTELDSTDTYVNDSVEKNALLNGTAVEFKNPGADLLAPRGETVVEDENGTVTFRFGQGHEGNASVREFLVVENEQGSVVYRKNHSSVGYAHVVDVNSSEVLWENDKQYTWYVEFADDSGVLHSTEGSKNGTVTFTVVTDGKYASLVKNLVTGKLTESLNTVLPNFGLSQVKNLVALFSIIGIYIVMKMRESTREIAKYGALAAYVFWGPFFLDYLNTFENVAAVSIIALSVVNFFRGGEVSL